MITCRTDLGDGGWATLLEKLAGGPRAFEDKHREAGWGGPSHRAFGGQAHASQGQWKETSFAVHLSLS